MPVPGVNTPIADTFVLVLAAGSSLAELRDEGMLAREWAMYSHPSFRGVYRKMIVVTHGPARDKAMQRELKAMLPAFESVSVVCNEKDRPDAEHEMEAARSVVAQIESEASSDGSGSSSGGVLVKTDQLRAGTLAVEVRDALNRDGVPVALLARGGYLWSRFVAYDHGPRSPLSRIASATEAALCQAADLVVGTSEAMLGDLVWRYYLDPTATALVPNYVLVPPAHAQGDDDDPLAGLPPRDPSTVLYSGPLLPRKRVDWLIRAVAHLRNPAVVLRIVGEGPERKRLAALAKELSVHAVFEGNLPHAKLLELMSRCTAYAQASELEGHPRAVIEAMALGAAVVVADTPGLGGIVEHGVTGLRVLSDSPEGFSHALSGVLGDKDWRNALGGAALRLARIKYGLDQVTAMELAAHRRAAEKAFGIRQPRREGRRRAG